LAFFPWVLIKHRILLINKLANSLAFSGILLQDVWTLLTKLFRFLNLWIYPLEHLKLVMFFSDTIFKSFANKYLSLTTNPFSFICLTQLMRCESIAYWWIVFSGVSILLFCIIDWLQSFNIAINDSFWSIQSFCIFVEMLYFLETPTLILHLHLNMMFQNL